METLARFIEILAYILIAAIFLRVIFSWISFDPRNPLYQIIYEITEPILAPIRQFMPRMGMIDLAPMVASFLLFFIARAVSTYLT